MQRYKLYSLPLKSLQYSIDGNACERDRSERQHTIVKWPSEDVVSSLGIQRGEVLEEWEAVRNHRGGGRTKMGLSK